MAEKKYLRLQVGRGVDANKEDIEEQAEEAVDRARSMTRHHPRLGRRLHTRSWQRQTQCSRRSHQVPRAGSNPNPASREWRCGRAKTSPFDGRPSASSAFLRAKGRLV